MADPQHSPVPDGTRIPRWLRRVGPGAVPGCLGLIFVIIGIPFSWKACSFVMHTKTTVASVTSVSTERETSGSRSRTVYYPVLEFQDTEGYSHSFVGSVSSGSSWTTGRKVSVRYDPKNPDDARMAGLWDLLPHGFLLAGVLALALGIKLATQDETI